MADTEGVVFGVGDGAATASVAKRFRAHFEAGRLERTMDAMEEASAAREADGMSDCHHISLALLVDLTNAGEGGWRLMWGTFNGTTSHSWLERGGVAVDGSPHDDNSGKPILLIQGTAEYRRTSGSKPLRTYVPREVANGRYMQEEPLRQRIMRERGLTDATT